MGNYRSQIALGNSSLPPASTIYVLRLQGGKYYAGSTNNPQVTLEGHLTAPASDWLRKYPVEAIDYLKPLTHADDLASELKILVGRYGIANVRGEGCDEMEVSNLHQSIVEHDVLTQLVPKLPEPTKPCARCGRSGHFHHKCCHYTVLAEEVPFHYCRYCPNCGKEDHSKGLYYTVDCDVTSRDGFCRWCGMEGHSIGKCHLLP